MFSNYEPFTDINTKINNKNELVTHLTDKTREIFSDLRIPLYYSSITSDDNVSSYTTWEEHNNQKYNGIANNYCRLNNENKYQTLIDNTLIECHELNSDEILNLININRYINTVKNDINKMNDLELNIGNDNINLDNIKKDIDDEYKKYTDTINELDNILKMTDNMNNIGIMLDKLEDTIINKNEEYNNKNNILKPKNIENLNNLSNNNIILNKYFTLILFSLILIASILQIIFYNKTK